MRGVELVEKEMKTKVEKSRCLLCLSQNMSVAEMTGQNKFISDISIISIFLFETGFM